MSKSCARVLTFGHTGDLGDIIYALPTIKVLGGGKLVIYPRAGTREPMTRGRYEIIRGLLEAQPYIHEVVYGELERPCDFEFYGFRDHYRPNTNLAQIQAEYFGQTPDLSQPWLTVPKLKEPLDVIVINRTRRYRDPGFDWQGVLRAVGAKTVFIGLPLEHADFEASFGPVAYYPCVNLLEAARLIASSRAFIGNQSCCNAIAEGLKVTKLLERNGGDKNCDCIFPLTCDSVDKLVASTCS